MTYPSAENNESAKAMPADGMAGCLAFAAAPGFALMASIAACHSPSIALCSAGSRSLPVDGMTMMYVLMSVFHLSPWLRLACRPWART